MKEKNEKPNNPASVDTKEVYKDTTIEDYDYLTNSATPTDCTGLIYPAPQSDSEVESYQEVYQFLPPNVKVNGDGPE